MSGATRLNTVLYNQKLAWVLWFGLSVFAASQAIWFNQTNNFLIYRQVYFHLLQGRNLFVPYPQEYFDVNLYGPLFGLLIAPFSWLPEKIGAFAWVLFNVSFLLFALCQLPVSRKWKTAIALLSAHELMNASSWLQINAFICGCVILGFAYVQKGKDAAALFFIMFAAFVKLLGLAGLAFFFFSQKPLRFLLWACLWSVVFFFSPLLLTTFRFLIQSYKDWALAIAAKNEKNASFTADNVLYQNVSVLGMVRRIFYLPRMNDLAVLLPAFALFLSQYGPVKYFTDLRFRLYILCSVLLSIVLFSSGSESPTYIIAMPGICLWYLMQPKKRPVIIFFVAVFVLTTFSYSDIFTPWLREKVMKPYSLKALPSFTLWLVILVQIHTRQFLQALHPMAETKAS